MKYFVSGYARFLSFRWVLFIGAFCELILWFNQLRPVVSYYAPHVWFSQSFTFSKRESSLDGRDVSNV